MHLPAQLCESGGYPLEKDFLLDGLPQKPGGSAGCFSHIPTLITSSFSLPARSGMREMPDREKVFHIISLLLHFCLTENIIWYNVSRCLGCPFRLCQFIYANSVKQKGCI